MRTADQNLNIYNEREGSRREQTLEIPGSHSASFSGISKLSIDFDSDDKRLLHRRRKSSITSSGRRTSRISLQLPCKIKYQDFFSENLQILTKKDANGWTTTKYFQSLITAANKWLSDNPGAEPKTCETITWLSPDKKDLGDGEVMVTSKNMKEGSITCSVVGLRLWYLPSTSAKLFTISAVDFLPHKQAGTIQELLNSVNLSLGKTAKLEEIMNLETVCLPIMSDQLDSNLTTWQESMDRSVPYFFFLRLFLVTGRDAGVNNMLTHDSLSIIDFVPRKITEESYEDFEELVNRCDSWVTCNDVIVINLQSIFAQQDQILHESTGNSCFFETPGLDWNNSIDYFRVLRVVVFSDSTSVRFENSEDAKMLPRGCAQFLSYETFTPDVVKVARTENEKDGVCKSTKIESMAQTFSKLNTFLLDNNVDIVNVEMVSYPMQLRCDEDHLPVMQFLFSLRVFYHQRFLLSSNKQSGSLRSTHSERKSLNTGEESLHPGPIFLKNVVNKRFNYRWLVLALSAFTCMTIVVTVSVAYSHRK